MTTETTTTETTEATPTTETTTDFSGELHWALAQIWAKIRVLHKAVPGVMLLAAPAQRGEHNVLGHFAPLRWTPRRDEKTQVHEVVVTAEWLTRKPEEVLCTLIHEAAHAANWDAGIKDCSANQYHNEEFKTRGEAMGLTVEKVKNYGWAKTTIPAETIKVYAVELAQLESVMIHRFSLMGLLGLLGGGKLVPGAKPTGTGSGIVITGNGGGSRGTGSRMLKATCECGHIIRLARKTFEATAIRCETCGEDFKLV